MTAAAVAGPKLYAIEQRAIENAMAPTTLNKQAGAIVWHGSPNKFDKFDAARSGTGEGAGLRAWVFGKVAGCCKEYAAAFLGQNRLTRNLSPNRIRRCEIYATKIWFTGRHPANTAHMQFT